MPEQDINIAIIGLGYVGLPLACMFASKYRVTGFDNNTDRINEINNGIDRTLETDTGELLSALDKGLKCTSNPHELSKCDIFILTAPTPVNADNEPDLAPLINMTETVGSVMKHGATVIYESTVCPGTTEEICVRVLEQSSGLKFNTGFFVGYSPERVNPGDKTHSIRKIQKIVAGSTPDVTTSLERLYGSVLENGTYRAPSIRVAEAAKIIENTQRDVNIAFINEITKLFNDMGIDTNEVIDAASTKWNFVPYRPGLVGGHCIGVDPYYLINKAQTLGQDPKLMKTARATNENMASYLAERTVRTLKDKEIDPLDAKILILGFAFKADCPDTRNTKCHDVYLKIKQTCPSITIFDPIINTDDVMREYEGLSVISDIDTLLELAPFDAVVNCTPHSCFSTLPMDRIAGKDPVTVSLVSPRIAQKSMKPITPPHLAH